MTERVIIERWGDAAQPSTSWDSITLPTTGIEDGIVNVEAWADILTYIPLHAESGEALLDEDGEILLSESLVSTSWDEEVIIVEDNL